MQGIEAVLVIDVHVRIALGCSTAVYHAGLPLAARKQAHHRFINDDIRVGCACFDVYLMYAFLLHL